VTGARNSRIRRDRRIGIARAEGPRREDMNPMSEAKVIVTGINVTTEPDPWEVGMVTERIPAQDLYEDGIEPDENADREVA
jgi:hypothetical protein